MIFHNLLLRLSEIDSETILFLIYYVYISEYNCASVFVLETNIGKRDYCNTLLYYIYHIM